MKAKLKKLVKRFGEPNPGVKEYLLTGNTKTPPGLREALRNAPQYTPLTDEDIERWCKEAWESIENSRKNKQSTDE